MGCDIHFYVERRDGARWVSCDQWETEQEDGVVRKHVNYKNSFYHDRNYDLFAILADVRNGRGFAGVKTGEGFTPICEPRGIPDDGSPEYRAAAEIYGGDGHSHSWLTVAEIMAFDWTQTSKKSGVVKPHEWAQWKLNGEPRSWAGGITGASILRVSTEDMERAARKVTEGDLWRLYHDGSIMDDRPLGKAIYRELGGAAEHGMAITTVEWTIPYYDAGQVFLGQVLPRLWRLGAPDRVRACFFFDN